MRVPERDKRSKMFWHALLNWNDKVGYLCLTCFVCFYTRSSYAHNIASVRLLGDWSRCIACAFWVIWYLTETYGYPSHGDSIISSENDRNRHLFSSIWETICTYMYWMYMRQNQMYELKNVQRKLGHSACLRLSTLFFQCFVHTVETLLNFHHRAQ